MDQHILPGVPPVTVVLRRSARARRMTLRVSRLDGRVTLTLPPNVTEREALGFAHEKADWLRKQLSDHVPAQIIGLGSVIPIEGRPHAVCAGTTRRVEIADGAVHVPMGAVAARLRAYLRERARARLVESAHFYAGRLGRAYNGITIKDTRSRWGSCTAKGGLMFSWRLIMAPPAVLDYVAAHEVAHLAEMNHSAAFWAQVERIHGPYQAPRDWLRQEGTALHAYRFED